MKEPIPLSNLLMAIFLIVTSFTFISVYQGELSVVGAVLMLFFACSTVAMATFEEWDCLGDDYR